MLKRLGTIFVSLLFVVSACKNHSRQGPAVGACKFRVDEPRCQPGSMAAFCMMNDGGKFEWASLPCTDCAPTHDGVQCRSPLAGRPCDALATDTSECTPDGKSELTCDLATSKWTVVPCPSGCRALNPGIWCH